MKKCIWRENDKIIEYMAFCEKWNRDYAAHLKLAVNFFVQIYKMNLQGFFPPLINPLNAELKPICKSNSPNSSVGYLNWYSKNLNIPRTMRDKFVKQIAFCGEGEKHCSEYL